MYSAFTRTRVARTLVALSLLTAACNKPAPADSSTAAPSEVIIGPENVSVIEQAELSSGPPLSGQLTAERSASIRAEVAASVLSVMHQQGDRVAAGAPLLKLDDTAIRDMLLSARSGASAAQTALDQTQREVQRAERLHAAGAISDRELETARNATVSAQAQVADAKARVSSAQKQLDATEVKAPFAGVIAERPVSPGDVVAPGAPLFTVIDPSSLRLEASVPAPSLADVHIGMPVRFTVSGYGARTFEGRVTNINPSADPATGQVRIYASIPNTGGQLVIGLYAEGRVAAETRHGLTAPATAVDQRALRPFVMRLKGGKVERVEVTIGVHDEERERVELIGGGLATGDTLLLGAAQGITPGSMVRVSAGADARKTDTTKKN